ncbi:hypothetical protein [Herbiconiux sp. L3-i23]|uniref:hypothetical protein n=1 Tax=Herbiconiux sp. L3-i23 TaxID=2905871 RepID=UPI0020542F4A|nr:hypothetical protein [Herbiconiux sp. L3-i23]BDI21974.1 hypothetical protein L3i23_07500 [Herbiconiux sp. L3-i23]
MSARTARSGRALTAASVSTLVAAFSHTAGGGSAPSPVTLGVALAFAMLVSVALSSRRLSLWRLTLTVALSQAGFHSVFQLLGSRTPQLGHTHDAAVATAFASPAAMAHPVAAMWWAHAAAALITLVALVAGERILAGLVALARLVARRLVTDVAAIDVDARRPPPAHRRIGSPVLPDRISVLRHRGPPLPL